jgi:hypothetical protein
VEVGKRLVRRPERVPVWIADPRDDVPVVAGRAGKSERRARGDDVQALLGVERVRKGKQVELVRAAAVVEHEQAGGIAPGEPLGVGELSHAAQALVRGVAYFAPCFHFRTA